MPCLRAAAAVRVRTDDSLITWPWVRKLARAYQEQQTLASACQPSETSTDLVCGVGL